MYLTGHQDKAVPREVFIRIGIAAVVEETGGGIEAVPGGPHLVLVLGLCSVYTGPAHHSISRDPTADNLTCLPR